MERLSKNIKVSIPLQGEELLVRAPYPRAFLRGLLAMEIQVNSLDVRNEIDVRT